MVRGGVRSKASGGNHSPDSLLTDQPLALNLTLLQILQIGFFEKDLLTYCANRLTEYSCIYWLDPFIIEDGKFTDLNMAAYGTGATTLDPSSDLEFAKYPTHFIDQNSKRPLKSFSRSTSYLTDGKPLTGTFLGPLRVASLEQSETKPFIATLESNHINSLYLYTLVFIPPLMLCGSIITLSIMYTSQKLSCYKLPIITFLKYLAILDQCNLLLCGIDFLVEAQSGIRLFVAGQFLGRFSCQMIPMIYNLLRHIHASLSVAFAIQTAQFLWKPFKHFSQFQKQFARNTLILISAISATLNCQFVWTFDLFRSESKKLHDREVYSVYECSFSGAWVMSPIFLNYVWPIVDHLNGDILPCLVCLLIGFLLNMNKTWREREEKQIKAQLCCRKYLTQSEKNKSFYGQLPPSMNLIRQGQMGCGLWCCLHGIALLPGTVYYMTKYSLFSGFHTNRNGFVWSDHEYSEEFGMYTLRTTIERMNTLRPYEAYLDLIEYVVRMIALVEIPIRGLILIVQIREYKDDLITHARKMNYLIRKLPFLTWSFVRNKFYINLLKIYLRMKRSINRDEKIQPNLNPESVTKQLLIRQSDNLQMTDMQDVIELKQNFQFDSKSISHISSSKNATDKQSVYESDQFQQTTIQSNNNFQPKGQISYQIYCL